MKLVLALALITAAFAGCSGRRLPPGTLPPEYEPPIVTPWVPESADAGAEGAAPSTDDRADAASPPALEPELSLDAGPR